MSRPTRTWFALLSCALSLAACGDDGGTPDADTGTVDTGTDTAVADTGPADTSTADTSTGMGMLTVTITAPDGIDTSVTVSDGTAETQVVTETTTLTLPAGDYSITADPFRVPGTLVDEVYDGTPDSDPVTVTADATAEVTVTYATRFGSGHLFGAIYTSELVVGFSEPQLVDGFSDTAAIRLASPAAPVLDNHAGVALDAEGNLWVTLCGGRTLARYDVDQLATGTPTPSVIVADVLPGDCAVDLAFGDDGRLYVAAASVGLVIYEPEQLVESGAPVPVVIGQSRITEADGVAISPTGDVWVADWIGDQLLRYTSDQVASTGDPVPATTWSGMDGVVGIAFDADGMMWVSMYNADQLLAFDAAAQAMPTLPTPTRQITSTDLDGPESPAFDNQGNLWVPNFDGNDIVMFAAADLATGGALSATVTIGGTDLVAPYDLAFSPPPTDLPLRTPSR